MIQLFPSSNDDGPTSSFRDSGELDEATQIMLAVGSEVREPHADRPWVYTNMVAAADGATAVEGLSGALGGDGDRMMFRALRAQADIILVGAGTARAEKYRPPRTYDAAQPQRAARGQQARPRIALVTRSLDLDPSLGLFDDSDPDVRPFVISSSRSLDERGSDLEGRAEPIAAGTDEVDLRAALEEFKHRGHNRILCEGGPSLNGQLVAAGLIDEWNLTIAPMIVGGDSKRAAVGPLREGPPPGMTLDRVWLRENYLFCRWVRNPG